jgi:hypothetical protein
MDGRRVALCVPCRLAGSILQGHDGVQPVPLSTGQPRMMHAGQNYEPEVQVTCSNCGV